MKSLAEVRADLALVARTMKANWQREMPRGFREKWLPKWYPKLKDAIFETCRDYRAHRLPEDATKEERRARVTAIGTAVSDAAVEYRSELYG